MITRAGPYAGTSAMGYQDFYFNTIFQQLLDIHIISTISYNKTCYKSV